jgi:hypothetical protein
MYCVAVGGDRDSADEGFLGCFRKVAIEALPNHALSISDQAKLKEARESWDQARLIFVLLRHCAWSAVCAGTSCSKFRYAVPRVHVTVAAAKLPSSCDLFSLWLPPSCP